MMDPAQGATRSDEDLLKEFVRKGTEEAFGLVVERYLGMVFGVALRRLRNHPLAEEAAQNAFIALARKAAGLKRGTLLGGWLHRAVWIECAEILRREARRKEIMRQYAENLEATADGQGNSEGPLHAMTELLDEAILHLPDSDRDALILRFHGKLPLKELAARLGISEEASRKRVDRALEKLSSIMARRGAAASAAGVAASLTSALAGAAPAGLAVAVTQGAVAATASAGASVTSLILLMTHTHLKITGASVLFLLAVSFFAGRHNAKEFGDAVRFNGLTEPEQAELWSKPLLPGQAALQAQAVEDGKSEAWRILEEAVRAVREAEDGSKANYAAILALEPLTMRHIPEAVAFLNGIQDSKVLNTLVPLVAGIWARTDGLAASEWVAERLKGGTALNAGYHRVLRNWASHDPRKAFEWYHQKAQSGMDGIAPNSFRWLSSEIFEGWAARDPWEAALAVGNVPVEDRAGAIQGFCDAVERTPHPAAMLSAVQNMPDVSGKPKLIEEVSERLAKASPEAAAAWLDSVWVPDPKEQFRARMEVAEEWLRQDSGDLLKAGAWLLAGTPSEMRQEILEGLRKEIARRQSSEK